MAFRRGEEPDEVFSVLFDEILARYGPLPPQLDSGIVELADTVSLAVLVVDLDGLPLEGAQVVLRAALPEGAGLLEDTGVLRPLGRGAGIHVEKTDFEGWARFAVPDRVTYKMYVDHDDHSRWQEDVQIQGPAQEVQVVLDPGSSLVIQLGEARAAKKPGLFATPSDPGPGRDRGVPLGAS